MPERIAEVPCKCGLLVFFYEGEEVPKKAVCHTCRNHVPKPKTGRKGAISQGMKRYWAEVRRDEQQRADR